MGATRKGKTVFSRNNTKTVWNFAQANFYRALTFNEGSLHPNTKLRSAHFYGFTTEEDYHNYRTLKRECSSLHAREEENIFFSHEQRTLTNLRYKNLKSFHLAILGTLYDLTSRYAQGPGQALLVLIGFMFTFWGGYEYWGWLEVLNEKASWAQDLPPSFLYTLQNILYPFSQFSGQGIVQTKAPEIALLGIGQTILFFVIFGFFIFAVRRKFRKVAE